MKRLAIGLMALAGLMGSAQAQSPFTLSWHGFVNPHYYADSRSVVGGREDMMLFYPKPIVLDSAENDINDDRQANMLSITARLNLTVNGPDMLGAHTLAFIEGDFTGSTNASNNNLRLRHAYLQLDWGKRTLLAGQYWYPMVVHEIMPNTRPLNMGAPFHPYARYNQLRYTRHLRNWEAIAVAMYQQDNMSQGLLDGEITSSTQFQRRGFMPELHLQLRYNGPRLLAGAAANMLTIQPRIFTQVPAAADSWGYDSRFRSFSYSLFLKYKFGGWALSTQTLLNNSLYEGCSLGGYVLPRNASVPYSCIVRGFRPWHFNTVWMDFGRTTGHWRPGIFVGYGKNMCNDDQLYETDQDLIVGRGRDIEYLWRVQPRIGYHANDSFSIYAEAEYTFAQYLKKETYPVLISVSGTNYAYVHDPNGGVGNLRLMLSAEYKW